LKIIFRQQGTAVLFIANSFVELEVFVANSDSFILLETSVGAFFIHSVSSSEAL